DAAPDDQESGGQARSQDSPTSAADSPLDEPFAAEDNESESSWSITPEIRTYSGFPRELFRLTSHLQPVLQLSLTLPPALEGERAGVERQVLGDFEAHACAELSPSEVRQLLEEAASFRNGLQWTRAKTALIRRLVEVGGADTAVEQARATWPDDPPAQVIAAILPLVEPAARRGIATSLLAAVWEIEEPMARADALAALLGEIDGADHERALHNIEDV